MAILVGQLIGHGQSGQQNGGKDGGEAGGAVAAICQAILTEYSAHILLGGSHIAQLHGIRFVGVVAKALGNDFAII